MNVNKLLLILAPIELFYTTRYKYTFKDGYFLSIAPGLYKPNEYGIRLKNVLEVVDAGKISGIRYLTFRVATLVPFEMKFIDLMLLSPAEVSGLRHKKIKAQWKFHFQKKWLNEYNAMIRNLVGEQLKKQKKMQAFFWMMNNTKNIPEIVTDSDYKKSNSNTVKFNLILTGILLVFTSTFITT